MPRWLYQGMISKRRKKKWRVSWPKDDNRFLWGASTIFSPSLLAKRGGGKREKKASARNVGRVGGILKSPWGVGVGGQGDVTTKLKEERGRPRNQKETKKGLCRLKGLLHEQRTRGGAFKVRV